MSKVGIVMGSDSDLKVMGAAAKILEEFNVEYDMQILSAHRCYEELHEWAATARERDISVIIAGAGMAAHLPGICAAIFPLPVIGVPLYNEKVGGMDALYSIVQMPPGVPVATVGMDAAKNAALLAVRMLAVGNPELEQKMNDYMDEMKKQVLEKNLHLQSVGYENYKK